MNAIAPMARISQLIRMLGSASNGELSNARDALVRALKAFGLDFHDVADLVERNLATKVSDVEIIDYPTNWRDMVKWLIENNDGLDAGDYAFIFGLCNCKGEPDFKECSRLRTLYAQGKRRARQ